MPFTVGGDEEGSRSIPLWAEPSVGPVLRIVPADPDHLEEWRAIHNAIIPTAPLGTDDVKERATRNRLTLGYDGDVLVGNATVRPPDEEGTAVVIVRILPEHRRRGHGSTYLTHELGEAESQRPAHIGTVVLASNEYGLAFALARGFAEVDRYLLPGDTVPFVDLRLGEAQRPRRN
jgi:GNAT superfamily N-acetyltransferase